MEASKSTTPPVRNFLVFEAHTNNMPHPSGRRGDRDNEPTLVGYNCIGGVAAQDEAKAVMAAMSVTKRIGKYAVIEATFVDFSAGLLAEAEADRPQLNP
jgi:hypothetical protein